MNVMVLKQKSLQLRKKLVSAETSTEMTDTPEGHANTGFTSPEKY